MMATLRQHVRILKSVAGACLVEGCLAGAAWGQAPPMQMLPAAGPPPLAGVPVDAIPPAAPGLVTYSIVGGDVAGVAAALKGMFVGRNDVNIVAEPHSGKLLVVAVPHLQRDVERWLAGHQLLATAPLGNPIMPAVAYAPAAAPRTVAQASAAAPAGPPPAPPRLVTQSWALRNLNWREFENSLLRTWGTRVAATQDSEGDMATFRFPGKADGTTSYVVDRRNNLVSITSPAVAAQTWLRMAQIIDSRPKAGDERTAVVALDKSDPLTVRRAIELIRRAAPARPAAGRVPAGRSRKQHVGEFVAMLFQQPEFGGAQPDFQIPAGPGGDEVIQAAPTPGDAGGGLLGAVARLAGNVRIEILDDIVIVQGRQADVDKVMRIIGQIEQQSLEFKPEVEVYYLKNVDGQQLNVLIQQVYAAVFARQGRVEIVPLVDPNALLLIGRKENIPAVVELIAKLDVQLPPASQFKVFHLKHMSCIDAERTVKQFFTADPLVNLNVPRLGTGIKVYVIAEYRANALIVQASPRDMAEVERLIASLDVELPGAESEVRVFKLKNSVAETLAPVLLEVITGIGQQVQQQQQIQQGGAAGSTSPPLATRRAASMQIQSGTDLIKAGVLDTMRITADTGSNSILVAGPPSAMPLMEAIIAQLDGLPPTEAQIKVFSLFNADATAIATMLQTLFGQTQQGGQQQQPFQLSPTGTGESALVPLRFSVDQRTNTIIASGNPGDLQVVRDIIVMLDSPDATERINTVIKLHNAPALDVATAITNLLTQQRTLNQAAPELVTPYQQIEREVLIEPEVVTNSLIISATPRYFEQVQRIIKELDKRPPMVMIQVLIAEVTLNDDEQFGIEWGLQDSLMFDRSIQSNRFAFNSSGFPNDNTAPSLSTRENVAGQVLGNLGVGRVDPTLGFGGLVLTASNESVNVLLRALERSSRLQVISRPEVQTLDNQRAYVNVGALVPRIQGANSNGLTITPLVEDISVGIILEVTPRTSPDGTIVMLVNATKSSVGPDATGIPVFTDSNGNVVRSPQIPLTTAQTTVSARSGQTVILGGLITKNQSESTRRIPYLGDIPVLGRLFRFDTVSNQRTELLIIMTPYINENSEQNEWINARESERMSWCLADIVNIHGPVGMSGNPAFNMQPSDVIFPDLYPAGPEPTPTGPQTPAPAPSPLLPMPYGPPGTPPPPMPMLTPPGAAPPPAPTSIIVPQPASLAPPAAGESRALTPQILEPAAPPVGTQSAYRRLPATAGGNWQPQTITPAGYQQPLGR